MRFIWISLCVLACGTAGEQGFQGSQGPEGPQGPPGADGHGGKVTFPDMAGALSQHFIMNGASFTFDIAEPPATATSLYLEVSACLSAASAAGPVVRFHTAASSYYVAIAPTTVCTGDLVSAVATKQVWMESASPHQVEGSVDMSIGTAEPATARVRVLGWYEP